MLESGILKSLQLFGHDLPFAVRTIIGTLLMELASVAVFFGICLIVIIPSLWILTFLIKIRIRISIFPEAHNLLASCYLNLGNSTNVPLLLIIRTSVLILHLLVLDYSLHLLELLNLLLGRLDAGLLVEVPFVAKKT